MVYGRYDETAPRLTLEVGIRHESSSGWNEEAGRAANYVTNGNGVLVTAPITGNSAFTQNNAKWLFGPRAALAWDIGGNGRTVLRAGFGTYYSLIDDLSFLLNSLPPYNGALTFAGASLPSILPIQRNATAPPSCGPGVPPPCTTFAPQGVQPNAKTPAVQEWRLTLERQLERNTVLRLSYVGSFGYHGLLSMDPNSIAAQICAQRRGLQGGRERSGDEHGGGRDAVYTRGYAAESVSGRRLLLVHGREQQLQRAAGGREAPAGAGTGISRELHVVEEPGHEFGANGRSGKQSGADDSGYQRSAQGLGAVGIERDQHGQHFDRLMRCRCGGRSGGWADGRSTASRRC